MPIQNTPTSQTTLFPVSTGTGTGTFGIQINPQNPNSAPNIVDSNGTVIASWNTTTNSWSPLDANTKVGTDNTPIGAFLNQNSSTFTQNTTRIINQLPEQQKQSFISSNSFTPFNNFVQNQAPAPPSASGASGVGGNVGAATTTQPTINDINNFNIPGIPGGKQNFGDFQYPKNPGFTENDYIKFTIVGYGNRSVDSSGISLGERAFNKEIKGTVKLPIQSQISDSNSVKWNENTLNGAQLMASGIALEGISKGPEEAFAAALNASQGITQNQQVNESVKTLIKTFFTEQATGTSNLSSRLFGAVINPNLELLFEGPALRPFNFTFKLTARDEDEAKEIKKIIRFFKEGMAVQRSVKYLFLKTPNVFEINYFFKNKNHPGMNKIKKCALQTFNVDYTPEGSYMAYQTDGTMVSYVLQMQFMELEPIYQDDYQGPDEEIGY